MLSLTPTRPFPIVLFVTTIIVLSSLTSPVVGQSSTFVHQKIMSACQFLISLYDPTLQLVKTTLSSNVYYIASDNLLAKKAVTYCDKAIGQDITHSISPCCGTGNDYAHESLLGQQIPLPIHAANMYPVANSSEAKLFRKISASAAGSNYTVLWEVHNATGTFPDCTYADISVYTALELKQEGNTIGAQREMDCLTTMFDGRGMVDEAYKAGLAGELGIYQTYKLALYIYALQKLSGTYYYGEEENLFRLQGPDGGFHTGYDQIGTYAETQENAETTSIAMIVISNLSTTSPFPFTLSSIPSWVIYSFAVWAAIGVGVVITVLVLEQRKRKQL